LQPPDMEGIFEQWQGWHPKPLSLINNVGRDALAPAEDSTTSNSNTRNICK
jgi:hypothetical protein